MSLPLFCFKLSVFFFFYEVDLYIDNRYSFTRSYIFYHTFFFCSQLCLALTFWARARRGRGQGGAAAAGGPGDKFRLFLFSINLPSLLSVRLGLGALHHPECSLYDG